MDATGTLEDVEEYNVLYRFYDAEDRLLYVGITMDLGTRWRTHNKDKPWFRQVVRATMTHFDTRAAVLQAEYEAIKNERPIWNGTHNYGPSRRPLAPRSSAVARGLFGDGQWLSVTQAAKRMNTYVDRVRHLADAGYLRVMRAPTRGRGRGHRRIHAESLGALMECLAVQDPGERQRSMDELRRRNRGESELERDAG